ncbi:EamA family transporter, partial [Streptomyces sp. KL116D]|uniref:EamA family transporter n=1 Tax=Streptomyces sp. KL116D TaxID=3045152 RepID=UPI003558D2E8
GLACYLLATRSQLLAVAVVLASLYPVVPVLLGLLVLRERVTRTQAVGLVAAAAATVLLTAG